MAPFANEDIRGISARRRCHACAFDLGGHRHTLTWRYGTEGTRRSPTSAHGRLRLTVTPQSTHVAPWLPLLRRLTEATPRWAVWKNADLALSGDGDIDSVAPTNDWPLIAREFRAWSEEHELGPVFACTHIPVGVEIVAVPRESDVLVELGAKARRIFRGSTIYTATDFVPFMQMDARGFRRLRPGAEGLFQLVLGGLQRNGRPRWDQLHAKNVPELLRDDPAGVRAAARLLGIARAPAVAAADAAARGEWDRAAVLFVQARSLARSGLEPQMLARKLRYQFLVKSRCPFLYVLFKHHRRIPTDRERWLHEVALDHDMWPA